MKADAGDYVLPVDKPVGPTSHDVVASTRRALGTRRVGHTGTLDPFASGLLVLCIGGATRLAEYLSGLDKSYVAVARLGTSTDTLDLRGEVIDENDTWTALEEPSILAALEGFRGGIEQIPPQFSAKKVAGEAMHRRARRGEHLELDPVAVTVHDLEAIDIDLPEVRFTIRCSSGTYVRAIARDLGERLGVGAHLTELRRTAVGRFRVEEALSVERLGDPEAVAGARIEPVDALGHLSAVSVDEDVAARLGHGQRVRIDAELLPPAAGGDRNGERLVAVTHARDLLAVAELDDGVLRPRKVFRS